MIHAASNLRSLCKSHHSQRTAAEQSRWGNVVAPPSVGVERVVVTGAPGSGKTTYVNQRRRSGDVVWDADAIATTIAQQSTFPRSPHIAALLAELREALIRRLNSAPYVSAYLIVTDPVEAQAIATRINGRVHRCERSFPLSCVS